MQTISAKEAKVKFGQLLDNVQREPVAITKHGRPVAVVLALENEEVLAAVQDSLEDHYWGRKALKADQEGYLSVEESEAFLAACLDD